MQLSLCSWGFNAFQQAGFDPFDSTDDDAKSTPVAELSGEDQPRLSSAGKSFGGAWSITYVADRGYVVPAGTEGRVSACSLDLDFAYKKHFCHARLLYVKGNAPLLDGEYDQWRLTTVDQNKDGYVCALGSMKSAPIMAARRRLWF
jgi:hypothetical protein